MPGSEEDTYVHRKQPSPAHRMWPDRIQNLNDNLRRTQTGGIVAVTSGIQALGPLAVREILTTVQQYNDFAADAPHFEHDFGRVTYVGTPILWKIDCYDKQLKNGSPETADPSVTTRVPAVLLASGY
nr:DUF3768 domain-containing protein [uncultured Sphingomonas sp.]